MGTYWKTALLDLTAREMEELWIKVHRNVPLVRGTRPRNWRRAGEAFVLAAEDVEKYGVREIQISKHGFPDFSKIQRREGVVVKGLTGDMAHDVPLAQQAWFEAYREHLPEGYLDEWVWHHKEGDVVTRNGVAELAREFPDEMQLVPRAIHDEIAHTGGRAVIKHLKEQLARQLKEKGPMAVLVGVTSALVAPKSKALAAKLERGEKVSENEILDAAGEDFISNVDPGVRSAADLVKRVDKEIADSPAKFAGTLRQRDSDFNRLQTEGYVPAIDDARRPTKLRIGYDLRDWIRDWWERTDTNK